jgi:hypothetical protein
MKVSELKILYRNRSDQFGATLKDVQQSIDLISNLRLTAAIGFVVTLYFGFKEPPLLYALPAIALMFALLMQRHGKLFEKKTHLTNLVQVNELELQQLGGDLSKLDKGESFINSHHPYSHDLDIFGEGSLYQHINRNNTLYGKRKFADRLTAPLPSAEAVVENQKAINELAGKYDFRQHYQAAGMEIEEQLHDRARLQSWLKIPTIIYGNSVFVFLLIALPVLAFLLIGGWIYWDLFKPFVFLMAAVQWGLLALRIKKVNAFHEHIGKQKNILARYAALLHRMDGEKFESPLMQKIALSSKDAGAKVKQLANLVYAFDARSNSLMSIFINSFLLYDLQCVYRLEKWREENAGQLIHWLDATAETEVLCSFATFAFNNERFTYPKIQSELGIAGKAMGHPLIPEHESVANDFKIGSGGQVLIVTGANMAGKSTFLRTVGINLILALNGAPVCASDFTCPIVNLRTGMRTADSLKDHQSYFYAELDRLKGIMDELRQNIPLLILLDEILKGTNSTDKQTGSIALVKQLLPHPCLAIIATHDLALGDLEKEYPNQVRNYCFEANIENGQLSFDYTLKPGLATKMNATFLMKKMGIIPS